MRKTEYFKVNPKTKTLRRSIVYIHSPKPWYILNSKTKKKENFQFIKIKMNNQTSKMAKNPETEDSN